MFPTRMCTLIVKLSKCRLISPRFHLQANEKCLSTSTSKNKADTVDMAFSVYDEHLPSSGVDDRIQVVVGHGIFGNRNNWHSLAKAMNKKTKRRIYTVDFRCHGESPHRENIDYDLLSDDLLHFVSDRLRLTRIAFVGHSFGGIIALYAAIKRPALVECLTSVDMALERFKKPDETIRFIDAMLAAKWDPSSTLTAVRKQVDAQLTESIPIVSIRQWLLTNLVHDGTKIRWNLDLVSLRRNCPILYGPVNIPGNYLGPTLYLCGAKSNFVQSTDHEKILARFPNSRFEYVPEAGHWVHSEKPQEYLQIQCQFLNDIHDKYRS